MSNKSELTPYLLGFVEALEIVFPGCGDGDSDFFYDPLLELLHRKMSYRNLTDVLVALTGKPYGVVMNDVLHYAENSSETSEDSAYL